VIKEDMIGLYLILALLSSWIMSSIFIGLVLKVSILLFIFHLALPVITLIGLVSFVAFLELISLIYRKIRKSK